MPPDCALFRGVAVCLLLSIGCAQPKAVPPNAVVLKGVTIIDVTAADPKSALSEVQDVLVVDERIAGIGATIRIPPGAAIVEATGKFLIPGLWDMHVHVGDPSYFGAFISSGITGVRDMGGDAVDANDGCESIAADSLLEWRSRIRAGSWIGPRILISGPAASGSPGTSSLPARTPDEARRAVDSLRALGVDFIKVYEKVPLDAYRALLQQAKKAGLPVAGHVPVDAVTPVQAATLGQRSIEHIRDHLLMCFTDDRDELSRFFAADHWSASDVAWGLARHDECEAAVRAFRRHSTWLVPTLNVERAKVAVEEPRFVNDTARSFLPRSVRDGFVKYAKGKLAQRPSERASEHLWWRTQERLVGAMHRKGVGLLAGTDAACEGGIPGPSLHRELWLLVEAGLTPLEALKTATINPARFLGTDGELGAIREGYIADVVVLDRNPLDDIDNTKTVHAVLVGGRLFSGGQLAQLIKRP